MNSLTGPKTVEFWLSLRRNSLRALDFNCYLVVPAQPAASAYHNLPVIQHSNTGV